MKRVMKGEVQRIAAASQVLVDIYCCTEIALHALVVRVGVLTG